MELIRSHLEQSAKVAASTARQLSSLDDMAQKDDYVQSEGLRVSAKKENISSLSSLADNSVIEDLSGRFVDAFSTVARQQSFPRSSTNESRHLRERSALLEAPSDNKSAAECNRQAPSPSASQQPNLIASVAALYDQSNKQKSAAAQELGEMSSTPRTKQCLEMASLLHELDYDSENDSSDDDSTRTSKSNHSGSDLEKGRQAKVAVDQIERELEESISRQNSMQGPVGANEPKKDVHRFMKMTADLESEREVLIKSLERIPEPTPQNPEKVETTNGLWAQDAQRRAAGELRAGMSWVRNVATPQLEALSKQIMTKVSEADKSKKSKQETQRGPMIGPRNPNRSSTGNERDEQEIITRTSASFLADDDMAELERIKMANSPSKAMLLITTCTGDKRFMFIAVTLILALVVYFYSRHRSVDDVL